MFWDRSLVGKEDVFALFVLIVDKSPECSCVSRMQWCLVVSYSLDNHENNHRKVNSKFQHEFGNVSNLAGFWPIN